MLGDSVGAENCSVGRDTTATVMQVPTTTAADAATRTFRTMLACVWWARCRRARGRRVCT
ncbi:hypothetical protein BACI9J_540004 [Bacillus altitudinis]|nr:hypothetical protein BACI9J_540004 [Bacillus altitudinis]